MGLITNTQIAHSRPYHTFFCLRDFYFDDAKYDSTTFPNGPYQFFKTYYETDSPKVIRDAWSVYSAEMGLTNCDDMAKFSGRGFGSLGGGAETIHSVLGFTEIGLVALSFLPTPLSPLFFTLGTMVGLTDATIYFAEGDTYMGMMVFGFSILGAGELKVIFKEAAAANKVAQMYKTDIKTAMETLGRRYTKGITNEAENLLMKDLKGVFIKGKGNEIVNAKYTEIINKELKNVKKIFDENKFNMQDAWNLLGALNDTGKIKGKTLITLGGVFATPIAIDELYLALFGDTEQRQNNPLFQMFLTAKGWTKEKINNLLSSGIDKTEEGKKLWEEYEQNLKEETLLPRLLEAMNGLMERINLSEKDIKTMVSFDGYNPFGKAKSNVTNENDQDRIPTPTLDSIRRGENYLFQGMDGNSVKQIQQILKNKWGYNLGTSGLNKDGVDGIFDKRMEDKIITFQETGPFKNEINKKMESAGIESMFDLDMLGIIDKNTLWFLENASPKDVGLDTLKLLPLGVEEMTDDNTKFYVNNKKYYFYRVSKQAWIELNEQEYLEKKNKGLKVKEEDNWDEISKLEYMTKTKKGEKTKYEQNKKIYRKTPIDISNLSRKQIKYNKDILKQKYEFLVDIKNNGTKTTLPEILTPEEEMFISNYEKIRW